MIQISNKTRGGGVGVGAAVVFFADEPNVFYLLSASHVLAATVNAAIGDSIVAMTSNAAVQAGTAIGTLANWTGLIDGAGYPNVADAAIAKLAANIVPENVFPELVNLTFAAAPPLPGTNLTTISPSSAAGPVASNSSPAIVTWQDDSGTVWDYGLASQIICAFSVRNGDSGAAVINSAPSPALVGLLSGVALPTDGIDSVNAVISPIAVIAYHPQWGAGRALLPYSARNLLSPPIASISLTGSAGNNSPSNIDFISGGRALTQADFDQAVSDLGGMDPLLIWAIIRKESETLAGFLANRKPVILYERHIFAGLTNNRFSASHPEISGPKYTDYGTLNDQYARLNEAMLLDQSGALQACSWGLGQVLGMNFLMVGYANVATMIAAMVRSEGEQLRAIVQFLKKNNLVDPLRLKDWGRFAVIYNGGADPTYAGILATDYAFYVNNGPPDLTVRSAQLYLNYLGYTLSIDGQLGNNTTAAVKKFQASSQIVPSGLIDPITTSLLEKKVFGS